MNKKRTVMVFLGGAAGWSIAHLLSVTPSRYQTLAYVAVVLVFLVWMMSMSWGLRQDGKRMTQMLEGMQQMIDEQERGTEHLTIASAAIRRGLRDLCGKSVLSSDDFKRIVESLYGIEDATNTGPSTTCFKCGWTSYHPEDVKQKYCANCHKFYNEMGFEQVER